MKQEGTPLSPAEKRIFQQLTTPLEATHGQLTGPTDQTFVELTEPLEEELCTLRAADSWQVTPRPNPLEEFDRTDIPARADNRKNIPLGHVAFMGDFNHPTSRT